MGKSSTGKDTLYQRILGREDLQLRQIISYTTRPIRNGEEEGLEYHFCTREEKDALMDEGKVIEIRSYHTCYGIWDYFTVADEQIDPKNQDYLIIGTVESYKKLRDYFTAGRVVPIYIEVEDGIRLERALRRERKQKNPKYEEMCRRFLADGEDFSEEKLREAGIDKVFYNEDIDRTEEEIVSYIKEEIDYGYKD
jgi:guanylate kinase